ncbi:MAG: sensor N-terminal transmembrane domain-containing protein [Pseudorhodobacter sp.]
MTALLRLRDAIPSSGPAPTGLSGQKNGAQEEQTIPRSSWKQRGFVALKPSPLARKIIVFNLIALVILMAGVLFLNPFQDSLVLQREQGLVNEVRLVARVIEAANGQEISETLLDGATIGPGVKAYLFDIEGNIIATGAGPIELAAEDQIQSTLITGFLNGVWEHVSNMVVPHRETLLSIDAEGLARNLVGAALQQGTASNTALDPAGNMLFSVATPVYSKGKTTSVIALTSAAGEIDRLVRNEREQILQMFVIAIMVSIGLSLVLASTIANPLSDLAAAAELGRDRDRSQVAPGRVRIPDLTERPDEIGRLSIAMRGMVAALYDRIDANEQFAADVAHEIKNPLASLRSAVASLGLARRNDQRQKLLEVIDHDVRRLDRLVSDISNASRLDSELVKEEEEEFDLLRTLDNLTQHLGEEAEGRGVEFITDMPANPVVISGLEGRLAQVFVNLICNAVSFCDEGDAVRIWARKRENRVLVVVEDTGPGIPEQALAKIFKRFYSERPQADFGNHSGLGLAISKQIVEAHGGVIWAENIRPTHADITSEPLGARFVVGLPL